MFLCNGSLPQHILRWDRDGNATVKETFLSSRINDLKIAHRHKVTSENSLITPIKKPYNNKKVQ